MRTANKKKHPIQREQTAVAKTCSSGVRQARDDLSPFFALSLDLMCIAGLDGYFKRLNLAWESILGWPLETLQARPFLDFVHADDRDDTLKEMRALAKGEATIKFENRYLGKDGFYRWLQWHARLQPERQLIYATASDITDRKRLEGEILEASDFEKERVGRELHDGLCQNLAGIAALSTTLSRKLAAGANPAAADAAEIARLLNETIGDTRDLARGLNPVGLEQMGLATVLEALAANVHALFRVACTFACDGTFPRLDPAVEMHLYRIAQQAVNNAITHGHAKRIAIILRYLGGKGHLHIRDDGVGISRKSLEKIGQGMHTMNYRVRLIGAALKVQRLAPRGTAIICAFSLLPAPPKERPHTR